MTLETAPKRVFELVLPVKPVGKGRPRFVRATGRTFTPEGTLSAEAEIRFYLRQAAPPILEGPLFLVARFVFLKPKSSPKRRLYPDGKPDLDNMLKLLTDAMNSICYRDDAQIVTATIHKIYGDAERIELCVGEM